MTPFAGKVLVLRGGALGDFLVTVPALRLLRQRWPEGRIELVGNATAAELGVRAGLLDGIHSQHSARWAPLFGSAPLPSDPAAWLAEFDVVINFWPDPDGALGSHFRARPGQRYLAAAAAPTTAPAARHFCEALRPLGLETADFRGRLDWTPTDDRQAAGPQSAPIALHPGSGSPRKNWPADRWIELIGHLDGPILLILGETERETLDARFRDLLAKRPGDVRPVECPPLPELAARLAGCRLFLGHDSGVSHLAAAVGTPCVLLFGPTDPAIWAPPGPQVRVIRRGPPMDTISVQDVLAALPAESGPSKSRVTPIAGGHRNR